MIEYRTERVDPNNEENIVCILGKFGWVLIDSQEIYSENTEILGADVKAYGAFMSGFTGKDGTIKVRQRKTVTNYSTLRFARDTTMKNYAQLRELNAEFENKLSYDEPKKPIKRTAVLIIGAVLLVISIILAIIENNSAELWEIIVSVVFMAVMIPLTIVSWVKYKKNISNYNCIQLRLYDILEEAEELMQK